MDHIKVKERINNLRTILYIMELFLRIYLELIYCFTFIFHRRHINIQMYDGTTVKNKVKTIN